MKPTIYNSKDVRGFLGDFQEHAKLHILEEGTEKDEIFEIAKARGIDLTNNPDLAGFKCIYAFADQTNLNNCRLPEQEVLKALPTISGKPVDIDHLRGFVVGACLDSRYIVKTKEIIVYGIFYKSNFSEEWETVNKLFAEGSLSVSFEIWSREKNQLI